MADVTVDIALAANTWVEISDAQGLANNARLRIDFDGNSAGKVRYAETDDEAVAPGNVRGHLIARLDGGASALGFIYRQRDGVFLWLKSSTSAVAAISPTSTI